jgi:two-component system, chemotaxis family, CheB/CheR fusion protein
LPPRKPGVKKEKAPRASRIHIRRPAARSGSLRENKRSRPETGPFPIVGIGASAGGLEAFEDFLRNMPDDSNMALLLVPHLDPSHISMMTDLLKRHTKMKVAQAANGMKVDANCVYIIPPNKDMSLRNRTIVLTQPEEPRGQRFPIDHFFRSLAREQKEKAVGIILSGNGSDGTQGLKAIKEEHGMVMAQEANTAKYDGMPRSAIETGLVDYILPPKGMPAQLVKYVRRSSSFPRGIPLSEAAPGALQKIFILLRSHTGHDFTNYKKNTICRRIERRMNVQQIEDIGGYVRYLQEHPREIDALFKELLIGVTNFFRDPEAFRILKEKLLPPMLASLPEGHSVRVWVPGCSGGEEVYSLAMVLRECLDDIKNPLQIQIFGTDIDNSAIQQARQGLYPASVASDVTAERLRRFFVKDDNSYRIGKEIRDMAVFAFQNVLKDPPFTKLDMVSCRNLLIYLDGELQKKIIPLFHYALKPGGILLLGTSETIGGFTDLFEIVDKKWKLFRRRDIHSNQVMLDFPTRDRTRPELAELPAKKEKESSVSALAERLLLEKYAPPCVMISSDSNILYTHGRTGKYLELAPGQARLNVLEMAREGLRHVLSRAIRQANAEKKELFLRELRVQTNGATQTVNVSVKPIRRDESGQHVLLISFEETPRMPASKTKLARQVRESSQVAQLQQDLKSTQEDLQTTIEELETSNEELKSTNEELQSTNEELQSTNEELETSKEELQSLNEELVTVNTELQGKIDELSEANSDMRNLMDSIRLAMIFLDHELRVKRFTSETKKVVNLIQSDIGRPLSDIALNFDGLNLTEVCQEVLDSLVFKEVEVRSRKGNWYLIRIMPYRAAENVISGVVATFTDISEHKRNEERLRDGQEQYQLLFELNPQPMWIVDRETLAFLAVNRTACDVYGYSREEFLNMTLKDLVVARDVAKLLRIRSRFVEKRTADGSVTDTWRHQCKNGSILEDQTKWRAISFEGKQAILSLAGGNGAGQPPSTRS